MIFEKIFDKSKAQWEDLTGGQRIVLASMVASLVISILVFSMWIRRPEMAVLASGMDYETASEVIGDLDGEGVDYRLTDGGRTVLVDKNEVSELRILLASSGALGGSQMGYELFDKEKIGITEFAQKINLQRALEGELSRTISELKAVERARVHIALPKESVFLEEKRPPTASVVLRVRAGRRLSPEQVQGIANLVSFSVEGLSPENVSIVDDTGRVLIGKKSGLGGPSGAQLEERQTIERYLSQKVEGLLSEVVGRGRARVAVNVSLNWEQVEKTKEYYDPEKSAIRSEERNESSAHGEGSFSESVITNYEVNKTIEHVLSAVGTVRQLSVSAFVDDAPVVDEAGNVTYQKRTEEELRKLEDIIKNSIGFSASRGDRISVVNMRFTDRIPDRREGDVFSSPVFQMLPDILGKFAAVGIVIMILLMANRRIRIAQSRRGFSQLGDKGTLDPGISGLRAMTDEAANVEGRIREIATSNPENVAKLVKTWMLAKREER